MPPLKASIKSYRFSTKQETRRSTKITLVKFIWCSFLNWQTTHKEKHYAKQWWNIFGMMKVLEKIIFSDEPHFHLNGYLNNQNCRYWTPNKSHEKHAKQLHSKKVTTWCAMSANGIIGPYFFEDACGRSVTVTSEWYWYGE